MELDPNVWGPHYWFFLHTISICYPQYPNAVTKKKYYELIQNFHLFIPIEKIANEFSKLIDAYPIAPYLDSKDSFIKWTHFIHNKINEKLEKPEISLHDFLFKYYESYKPVNEKLAQYKKIKEKAIYIGTILLIGGLIYYLYEK